MAVISVLFLGIWTFAIVRTLALRATLSIRTFATFAVLGALLGPIAWPAAQGFIDSYGSYGPNRWLLVALGAQVLLLLPILGSLFLRRADRATSVGDAFLLGFMIGFGYDLFTACFSTSTTPQSVSNISYFPPFAFTRSGLTAGFGYWSGLAALTLAAMLRFVRKRAAVYTVSAAVVLWATLEMSGLMASSLPGSIPSRFSNITLRGALTPWISLIALVVLSFWETRWVSRITGTTPKIELLSEWGSMLKALGGGNIREFQRLGRLFRLQRQRQLVESEISLSPGDPRLPLILEALQRNLRMLGANSAVPTVNTAPRQLLFAWGKRRQLQLVLLAAFLGIVLLLAGTPGLATFFWKISPLNSPLPSLNVSLLSCVLALVIVWRYLSAASRPFQRLDANDVLQFRGENGVLQLALVLVFLAFFYGKAEELFSIKGLAQTLNIMGTPSYDHGQLTTVMLLTATVATGLSLRRSERWKRLPIELRRATAVARALGVFTFFLGTGAVLIFFQQTQMLLHAWFGKTLFNFFGRNGNSAGDTILGILTIGFSFFVYRLLLSISDRANRFFVPAPMRALQGGLLAPRLSVRTRAR
jgi:hypothetical protein